MHEGAVMVALGCYLVAAAGYAMETQWGMALTFGAYALANVGLIVAGRGV